MKDYSKEIEKSFGSLLEKYDVDVPEEFEATLHGDGTCTAFLIVEVADKESGARASIDVELVGTHSPEVYGDYWGRGDFEFEDEEADFADKDEGFPMEDNEALKAAALELSQWVDVGKVYD